MVIFFVFLSIFLFIYICRIIKQSWNISQASSSPPTSTNAQTQVQFDVFLSFRGEDTRAGFTSHLHDALKRKHILTFIDDQLVRGEEISAALLRTIEEAKLSVVVFSEHYASSKWCLEELAKIFECRKNNGQIVIPVFYQVDPSHIRNQTESFGDLFAGLVKKKPLTMDTVQSFRDALTDAANLAGWSSREFKTESEFIEKIVGDVLNKLHGMSSSDTTGLVGIDVRVNKVESLLNMESQDVVIVGIWGMSGIGKTTIAQAVCNKVRSRFEGIFFANFREELRGSMANLRKRFLSELLGQEILNMGFLSFRDTFVRDRLRRKKVFIVLDDVDDSMPLEEWKELLHGRHRSFGSGSKVLMTSRDRQVFKNIVDQTYEVERLSDKEALQLFSSKALKNCISINDHRDLIEKIASRVKGNPLALIVLGSSLYGKSTEEWYSALNKLAQNPRIENALRISYDVLDEEQQSIFLDIAHFFRRFEKEQATRILDGFYRRSVIFDISTLIDKCLLTTSHNKLEIHDLLQELAFNIVRAESYKSPGKRSRLCHLPDVVQVMEENKGTEEIEGISLDISKLSRQIHLKPDAFAMMDGLRFLKLYFGHFSEDDKDKLLLPSTSLDYLSNKLVYFHWDGYPSKSLPHRFCAEHLVELNLRYSKVEKLWTGVQDIGNLRNIVLFHSQCLKELPDLSKAKKLVCLKLMGCSSLTKVPSSLQHLDKLEELDLRFCSNLSETAITEVPSSIQFPKKLSMLNMRGCSKITKFPEVSGDMETLILYETAITEVPSSIQFLKKLEVLDMSGCSKLESFPEITEPMEFLEMLHLNDTRIKEIPSLSFKHMISLRYLSLSGTLIKELPLSIKDMVYLLELDLDRTFIKTLPELPPWLTHLSAHHCESLETTMISTSTIGSLWGVLNFANCIKLDKKPLIAAMHFKIQSGEKIARDRIQMILPGSEIPEWFGDKGIGSSLTIQMPSNCHQLKGIAFCVVFLLPLPSHEEFDTFRTYLKCHVESKNDVGAGAEVFLSIDNQTIFRMLNSCHLDHMFLLYQLGIVHPLQDYSGKEVTFKFYIETSDGKGHVIRKPYELKSCGVYLHFDENIRADDTLFVRDFVC